MTWFKPTKTAGPTLTEASQRYAEAQRQEFPRYLPLEIDVNVYDATIREFIRVKVRLDANGTWTGPL